MKLNTEDVNEYFGKVFLPPCYMKFWAEGYSVRLDVRMHKGLMVDSVDTETWKYCPKHWTIA